MIRAVWLSVAWLALGFGAILLWWTAVSGDRSAIVVAVVMALAALALILDRRRGRRAERSLPTDLARLAYYADAHSVAFAWLFSDKKRPVRILRSEDSGALTAEDRAGQVVVLDGVGDRVVDTGLWPGRDYHYSLFVQEAPGEWSQPVRVLVATEPAAERIEREQAEWAVKASAARAGDRNDGRSGSAFVTASRGLAQVFSGVATDLMATVFRWDDRVADGWEEIV